MQGRLALWTSDIDDSTALEGEWKTLADYVNQFRIDKQPLLAPNS